MDTGTETTFALYASNMVHSLDQGTCGVPRKRSGRLFCKMVLLLITSIEPFHTPPPPHTVNSGFMPVVGPIKASQFSHIPPHHDHNNIHIGLSFSWWRNCSPFSIFPFLWSHALLWLPSFSSFTRLESQPCPRCLCSHPLDVISCLSFCPTYKVQQECFVASWPSPLQPLLSSWLRQAAPADLRNFFRSLLPTSLLFFLQSAQPLPMPSFLLSLQANLSSRNKSLSLTCTKILSAMKDNPLIQPLPPPSNSLPWSSPHHPLGTSFLPLPPPPPPTFQPSPLPTSVLSPTKRSKRRRRSLQDMVGD